jgi:SAM-dependent methyltransferase
MNVPTCRACGASLRTTFVDLGVQPVSNAFRRAIDRDKPEIFFPLHAFVCDACMLVQLQDFGSAQDHFHADYAYFSSFSSSWLSHAKAFAEDMTRRFRLGARSHVIEVASNDGYLLQYFKGLDVPCLGVDPAANCAKAARLNHGIETRVAFFGQALGARLKSEGFAADLMVANNVLAHVPDINDFVGGFRALLKPEGVVSFEFPHLMQLMSQTQFDTIYHEHYSYLSLLALEPLFARHGLRVFDVERLATHGGSLRLMVGHALSGHDETERVAALRHDEAAAGLGSIAAYSAFADRVKRVKRELVLMLANLKNEGLRIAAYGAPAKGNTLLNYAGMRNDVIDFTVDKNPGKQGLFLPGLGIPILDPAAIFEARPDILLILPWNLAEEIQRDLTGIAEWGGRFLIPIPSPRLLDA